MRSNRRSSNLQACLKIGSLRKMAAVTPITRDAFLYMEPSKDMPGYAQCGMCMMFTGSTCVILGPDLKITAGMSCGLYVHGHDRAEKGHEMKSVTPAEAGLVDRQTRCENCTYGDAKRLICTLFEDLNKSPKFKLNPKIKLQGCCNAQIPRSAKTAGVMGAKPQLAPPKTTFRGGDSTTSIQAKNPKLTPTITQDLKVEDQADGLV